MELPLEEKMIEIESSNYGKLLVQPSQIYSFPKGIVGLPSVKEYALTEFKGTPYYVLHSIDGELSFILIPANMVINDYEFMIDQDTAHLLGAAQPDDVVTLLVVNINDSHVYVNLKAPVLLAPNFLVGCQYVIMDREYPIRQPLSSGGL